MPSNKVLVSILTFIVITGGSLWLFSQDNTAHSTDQESSAKKRENLDPKGGRGKGDRPTPVLTAQVKLSDLNIVQTAVGTVISPTTVTVRSRVNGQLTKIYFQEGQTVKAGELLAELDARAFQAALTQMEGQALRDQAMLRNSQLDLERFKTLLDQDSIASQQVDAQASLVQQYQGTIKADQGLVENAKLQLSFTKIIAPISGRIGLRQIDVGNNILTTDNLAVINQIDPIQVLFTLPEDRVSDLLIRLNDAKKRGGHLAVEAWDRSNTTLLANGILKSLDNQIDATSGTIKLKAEFKNQAGLLYPNQFVNIKLLSSTLENALIAPVSAIQRSTKGEFVYLVSAEGPEPKVLVTAVTTGITDGINIEVKSGLHANQQIVVSGIDKLRDGAKVTLPETDRLNIGEGDRKKDSNPASKNHNSDRALQVKRNSGAA